MKTINVKDIIASPSAISPVKGIKVYEAVKEEVLKGSHLVLSFEGIEDLVSAFANASLGKLYMEFPKERLDALVAIKGLSGISQTKIQQAIKLGSDELARKAHEEGLNEIINS